MERWKKRRMASAKGTIACVYCAIAVACSDEGESPETTTQDGAATAADAALGIDAAPSGSSDAAHGSTPADGSTTVVADAAQASKRPNILLIVADDLGYSDIGAFGGEISTPNLDALASEGRILTDHHSGFTCAPTRSMLISGTDHHLVGLGRMGAGVGAQAGKPGYEGYLNERALSVAELLRDGGYHTYIAGKWHLGNEEQQSPLARGYESSYVLLPGVSTHFAELSTPPTKEQSELYRENGKYVLPPADFYSTDFYTDKLVSYIEANRADDKPFYAFAAYTSPHWPMQAPDAFRDRYRGRYDGGYEAIRKRRIEKQKELGIIPRDFAPNGLLAASAQRPTWDQLSPEQRAYEARRMEIYAAMVENLDYNIGRLLNYLKRVGEYDDTFIFFQSDNGSESGNQDRATANNTLENIGKAGSYIYVGLRWAEVSATPFRLFKSQSAEGGHSVPAIARLPAQRAAATAFTGLTHLTDLVPTFLDLAQVQNPGSTYKGRTVHPITGRSLVPVLKGSAVTVRSETDVVADEQNNSRYVRRGRWKLLWVAGQYGSTPPGWQLFDVVADRGETKDVAAQHPDVVEALKAEWDRYAQQNGVVLDTRDAGAGNAGDAGVPTDAAVGLDAGTQVDGG